MISQRKFPKLSADTITQAIARDVFDWKTWIVVPNVSWGLVPWEMDVAVLSGSNWLTEVEIKTSLADLKQDKEKTKWGSRHFLSKVKRYYVAVPNLKFCEFEPHIRSGAGIITVDRSNKARILREPDVNELADKLSDDERCQLFRLAYMRYWSRNDAASQLLEMLHGATEEVMDDAMNKESLVPRRSDDLFGDPIRVSQLPPKKPPATAVDEDLFG